MCWLEEGPRRDWPPKAATLARLAADGLPVPRGLVLPANAAALGEAAVLEGVQMLLERGRVIARGAMKGEDEAEHSAAGLGLSIGGIRRIEELRRAIGRIDARREDPWLQRYRAGSASEDVVIVQQQVDARWLGVAALLPNGLDYVEMHPGGTEALAAGTTPAYAGSVDRWTDPARDALAGLCDRVRSQAETGPHGLDLELVVDSSGSVWLVQARPIVTDLLEGWDAFVAELQRQHQGDRLRGVLVLDAEHNPAPLSFAHAWVMQWLACARPASGAPTVLAGWLYVRTLVRDLPGRHRTSTPPDRAELEAVLRRLRDDLLPEGRRRLEALERRLEQADADATARTLDDALAIFAWMIDQYLEVLVPVRARAGSFFGPAAIDTVEPLSTRGREAFADVLPTAWDIAAPTLAEIGWGTGEQSRAVTPSLPIDPAAQATLLTEWDDHLFALGLAPLRRVYLHAGELARLGDDVFALDGDELRAVLRGELSELPALLGSRRSAYRRFARLRPPLRIEDGQPLPTPPAVRLRGIAVGSSVSGRIAQRRDLQHLLEDPSAPDSIVVMPALTAQAAVALRELGVRAVCCAYGGALSHAALMARELGLSALIGCRGCLDVADGVEARLDTQTGRLRVR